MGYGWIDTLKREAEERVSDDEFTRARWRFPVNTPATKEGYFYRAIFGSHFPQEACARLVAAEPSVACSTSTALAWEASCSKNPDPSGRRVPVHYDAVVPAATTGRHGAYRRANRPST